MIDYTSQHWIGVVLFISNIVKFAQIRGFNFWFFEEALNSIFCALVVYGCWNVRWVLCSFSFACPKENEPKEKDTFVKLAYSWSVLGIFPESCWVFHAWQKYCGLVSPRFLSHCPPQTVTKDEQSLGFV